ncbi:MAG TPA: fluoride efflux transporter CrcB [Gemmatimonadales bacterium]|nr:fluoride efflux transporter CrcB [Gemmatimonadales bacterium]
MILLYIAVGGALGSVCRYLLGNALHRPGEFPTGTLVVNVLGSLLVGFVVRLALETTHVSPEARAFLAVGFCGGFTTFSTFAWELLALGEQGAWGRAALYLALSITLSLVACVAGMAAARETALALHR